MSENIKIVAKQVCKEACSKVTVPRVGMALPVDVLVEELEAAAGERVLCPVLLTG